MTPIELEKGNGRARRIAGRGKTLGRLTPAGALASSQVRANGKNRA
jgi:hypothetical protein